MLPFPNRRIRTHEAEIEKEEKVRHDIGRRCIRREQSGLCRAIKYLVGCTAVASTPSADRSPIKQACPLEIQAQLTVHTARCCHASHGLSCEPAPSGNEIQLSRMLPPACVCGLASSGCLRVRVSPTTRFEPHPFSQNAWLLYTKYVFRFTSLPMY